METNRWTQMITGHPIVVGAAGGLIWGAVMRMWMRYVAEYPEFSWSGTLFIVGAAGIVGTVTGVARHRQRAGGTGWWRLSIVSLLLLGAGGAVMWPAVLAWSLALVRQWRSPIRVVVALAGLASQWSVLQGILDNWRLDTVEAIIATVWYLPMLAVEAWAFSVAFSPSADGAPVPNRLKRVLIGSGVGVVGIVAVIAGGIPG